METKYSKITLLVDMDDTIEDLLPAWVEWLNNSYGTSVNPNEIIGWDMKEFFPSLRREDVYKPLYDNDFWETVKPKKDAPFYLSALQNLGFNLYICTTSNFQTIRCKLEFIINRYFPFINWDRIIITANKQLINADILVDDGLHNLIGGNYKKILMSAPHNESYDAENNEMVRVQDWEDAYKKIIECANEILENKRRSNYG